MLNLDLKFKQEEKNFPFSSWNDFCSQERLNNSQENVGSSLGEDAA